MPRFKPNQEVVFIGGDPNQNPDCINPKYEEIVTINYFHTYYKGYVVKGYEKSSNRIPQFFTETELREVEEHLIESIKELTIEQTV